MRTSPEPGPRARARCRRIALLGPRLRLPTSADFSSDVRIRPGERSTLALRAAGITSRLLAWTEMTIAGRSLRVRVRAVRLAKRCARAFLEALRAPGSPDQREHERCKRSRHAVPTKILLCAASRKAAPSKGPGCLRSRRNPGDAQAGRTLVCAARTECPSRRLRRGLARGSRAFFTSSRTALA